MLNIIHLIGNLGQDPEIINTTSGKAIAKFSLATSERYKDKSGELKTVTQWHRIQLWDSLAGIAEKYLKKGSKVYLSGKVQYNTYEDKDGVKRTSTDIVGSTLTMLSSVDSGSDSNASKPKEVIEVVPLDDALDALPF